MGAEKKILLVDDDADTLTLLKTYLEKRDFTVVTEKNGTDALKTFEEEKPQIIFLDIMMPGIDGFVTLRKIRGTVTGRQTNPVILMLTAKGDTEDVLTAIKYGANDYLVKPITEQRLIEKLEKQIGSID